MTRPSARSLPARGLVPLAVLALMLGVRYDADAAAARHKDTDGVLVSGAQGLPDLARGRQAAADGRLNDAEADLKPLAERGYVEAQIALAKLYARIGTPDRISAAIDWLREARSRSPEPIDTVLGRLLIREGSETSLSEGQTLLEQSWKARQDPAALAGLIRLYTQHPERDREQRIGALVVRAESARDPDLQGAVIAWYRGTPQIEGHRQKTVQLCARWLDAVPECHVDLTRAARSGGDADYLKQLVASASERYGQGVVTAQTLASLARAMVDAMDESADADAVAPAALPLKISDVPEHEEEHMVGTLRMAGRESSSACASQPVAASADPVPGPASGEPPGAAAYPDLANALLERLLKGQGEAPVLAAGVVTRYPYLLPGADIEAALQQGLARNVPEARLYLGQLYLSGARVPRDPARALQYLQQAAEQPGTALQGHYFLGRLYQYGYLDESQPLLAAEHLMWAARRGYVAADGALARLFASGKGICPNLKNAYVFAKLGARDGSASTKALQRQIAAQMSAEQLASADQLAVAELAARPSAYEIPETMLAQERRAFGSAPRNVATAMDALPDDAAVRGGGTGEAVESAVPAALAEADVAAGPAAEPAASQTAMPDAQPMTPLSAPTPSSVDAPSRDEAESVAVIEPMAEVAPATSAPGLSFSKSLSVVVPLETPEGEYAEPMPARATPDVASTREPAGARREVRLSHRPSEDAAVRALLGEAEAGEPVDESLQSPAQAPASGPLPATPGPAPSLRARPSGEES